MQPASQSGQRTPLVQIGRIDQPIGVNHRFVQRQRRQAEQAPLAQRIGGQHLARQRDAHVLLGGLQHQPGVVEHRYRIHAHLQAREREPALPHLRIAEQRLVDQCRHVAPEQALCRLGRTHR